MTTARSPPDSWGRAESARSALPWGFTLVIVLLVVGRFTLAPYLTAPALQTWSTIFVAICVQALPFLVFGVALSAAITAFVPASFWTRALPGNPAVAVPVAGVAGAVLPGCECASVPVASGLMARGVTPATAPAFLLASPAINPIALVAKPGRRPRSRPMDRQAGAGGAGSRHGSGVVREPLP
ncbi:permease [Streptosporangium sp. NPDC001681]|uniref:permease n=1 Tax=Streptosporangium sp. NPDC001681 TaxID=3154395 RepID=UPI003323B0F8